MLSISLLGDFCIRHDETAVTNVDTPRLQSLLAYLMLHRDASQSRAHLAFLFWPDTTETQARTNLRNLLHHLRRSLPEADSYLEVSVQTLLWRSDVHFALDVADFESSLVKVDQLSHKNDSAIIREALECAINLYKGDLLPSCYDDWILPQRERLRQSYLSALERLVGLAEEQRDYQAAIRSAQRLLQHDPLHEATYRNLIRLHALNGDRAGALRVYHTCTTILRRELDVAPSAATREAYEQLLGAESLPISTVPATTAFSPLVGREKEWKQLLHAWHSVAAGGEPHVMILSGEAGIGKTRLVEDMLQWAARLGVASANARCYAAEGDLAYAPVTTWLRAFPPSSLEDVWLAELGRLIPEVFAQRPDLHRPVALTEAWQRQRLFEALSRSILCFNQPLLLTMDDLQWCNQDTLEWLHFLLRFDRNAHFLLVGTYRPEEIGNTHPLLTFLQALRLEGQVTEVDLQPLDETATQTLATLVAGVELDSRIAQRLYQETEGNPLFVVETVRAGLTIHDQRLTDDTTQILPGDPSANNAGLPPKVLSVLESRLAQISPPSQELAGLAATIGREFSFKLLAKASGSDEDTLVHELDELWQRRIIREHGTDAYDFSHDKLREVAYRALSTAHRRLLHRHVAMALEVLHVAELDTVSHQLAIHYERAGLPEQAVSYYLLAAEVARQVYANEESIALLQHGLALMDEYTAGASESEHGNELGTQFWELLGDVFELTSQHEKALQAYQNAQSRVHHRKRIWQARLHRKVGAVKREQRLYAEALEAWRQAEIVLDSQPGDENSNWWDEWLELQVDRVWAYYWLAQWPEMDDLLHRVQPVVQERGGAGSRERFLLASCLMHLRRERYIVSDEMLANSREALDLSLEAGSLKSRVDCQFELGFLHLWRCEFDDAERNLNAALELAETSGIVHIQTLSLTYLTILNRFRGLMDGVLNYALQAQKVAEATHMPDYVAAAKGNQAWLAWRNQELRAAEQLGNEALVIWRQSPLVYPFQWQALWPLFAVALAQGREDEAWECAQALLEPTQQLLPEGINSALEDAAQAKAMDQAGGVRPHLDRAVQLAQEMGYL